MLWRNKAVKPEPEPISIERLAVDLKEFEAQRIVAERWAAERQSAADAAQRTEDNTRALADARSEEADAAAAMQAASEACTQLDREQRSWRARRDQAYYQFSEAASRHAGIKSEIERLSRTANVHPIAVAAGSVRG